MEGQCNSSKVEECSFNPEEFIWKFKLYLGENAAELIPKMGNN